MHWGDWGAAHGPVGHGPCFIGGLFWLPLLIFLIFFLVGRFNRRNGNGRAFFDYPGAPPASAQSPAMEILRQRYARGEIDTDTFNQMREQLESSVRNF